MQHLSSSAPKHKYLADLKAQTDSIFHLGQERFTGLFVGGFFSVTHHCEYNWFHRITSQMNSAIGFVKQTNHGCDIHFFKFKGILHPLRLLILLACVIWVPIVANAPWWFFLLTILLTLVGASIAALIESFTEGSIDGENTLWALLIHPENPYEYLYSNDNSKR